MRKLMTFRPVVCLVGALALAATVVIGASLTDTAVTNEAAIAPSAEQSPAAPRSSSDIEAATGSVDSAAPPSGVDAGASTAPNGAIGNELIGGDIAPIKGGTLERASATARDGPDADTYVTTWNTETGDATVLAPATTDTSQTGFTSDGAGAAADGVPYAGSASGGVPSLVGSAIDTGERGGPDTAAPVPEVATFVLVVVPLLAALIARLRS
jgi:hypothetical protein